MGELEKSQNLPDSGEKLWQRSADIWGGFKMNYELAFTLVNASVVPAWLMLIFLPRWSVTRIFVHSMLYPLVLGVVYTVGLGFSVFGGMGGEGGGFTTISAVRALFSTDMGILVGWTHYLLFDLFVGAWEARDARRRGFHHGLLIPCLFFTFMAGPLGLLLYVILRRLTHKGGWRLANA